MRILHAGDSHGGQRSAGKERFSVGGRDKGCNPQPMPLRSISAVGPVHPARGTGRPAAGDHQRGTGAWDKRERRSTRDSGIVGPKRELNRTMEIEA